jgi:hypothetical protein
MKCHLKRVGFNLMIIYDLFSCFEINQSLTFRRRKALLMTVTELRLMEAPAIPALSMATSVPVPMAMQISTSLRSGVSLLPLLLSMTSSNPKERNQMMASGVVDLIGSATVRIPEGFPSMATKIAVFPSS